MKTNKPDWEDKEKLAKQLHDWYLEAIEDLDPENYNHEAQRQYKDLREQQKQIDRYIAIQILKLLRSTIQAEKEALIEKIIKAAPKLAQNSLTRWGKEGDTYAKAFEKELLAKLNKK